MGSYTSPVTFSIFSARYPLSKKQIVGKGKEIHVLMLLVCFYNYEVEKYCSVVESDF